MKLSVLTLCVIGACSMSAYASTTNIVNAQSQFLMSHNGNKDDSSNVRKNGSYCETKTLNIVHNFEQDKTYQGVGIKKIDKVTGTYQTVCVKDGKQTFAPPYTQTYVNDITYEYQCTRRSEEKFEHYASDCVTSKNIYSNGVVGNDVRLMRFRGEENTDRSYSGIPSYESVVNSCNAMTLESRGTPVDACPIPIGAEGSPDIIRIEDISTQNNVATIRITDNRNTTDATATINYKSTKINLSKEWLDQLERVTIKNAKAKDWMFVTLKNPAGANAGVEPILQIPYVGNSAEPPQLHLCNNSQRFNWGTHSVSGSKVQDLSLIFNGVAGYKNIQGSGELSISQYPCEVDADSSGVNLDKARFPIVQGRHWEMNGEKLSATWDIPERVEGLHGINLNGTGQFIKDFQTRECKNPYLPTEDKEVCKLGNDLAPFIYNGSNRRQGVAGSGSFKVYRKNDILPLLLQGFNNIEILTIGRNKNMELTLEFTFKGNKPSISKKIEDDKKNCYDKGHDASCNEQDNENDNNTGGNNPMVPPNKLDPNKDYAGWIRYHCRSKYIGNPNKQIIDRCEINLEKTSRIDISELKKTLLNDGTTYGVSKNTGVYDKEHQDILEACDGLLGSYEERFGNSIIQKNSPQQLSCRKKAHEKYKVCLENHRDNYEDIKTCFSQEKENINNYAPDPLSEPLIDKYCSKVTVGEAECRAKFTRKYADYTCPTGELSNCINTIIGEIQSFKPNDYYDNHQTNYDGWFSYVCTGNGQQDCIRDFKKDYERYTFKKDLESKLLGKLTNGLLDDDNKTIQDGCHTRNSDLGNKQGGYLESICSDEIIKKHQNCLKENKADLQAIRACFTNKKNEIKNWYNEVFMIDYAQSKCNEFHKEHLGQCTAHFNRDYIKNFMEYYKDRLDGVIFSLKVQYLPILDEQIKDFKPVLQGGDDNRVTIEKRIQDRCIYLYNRGETNGASTQVCIENLRRQYNVCVRKAGHTECRSKINGFNM